MSWYKQMAGWCLVLALIPGFGVRRAVADEPSYTRTRDVIYGRKAGVALTMDVYRPKAKANGAAIFWLCSGDWMSDTDGHTAVPPYLGEALGRGYTVFSVVHSSYPVFRLDEIVPDVHRAVRHVRHHAKQLQVDTDRLAVMGISSGGHLAAHVGVSGGKGPPFPRPDITGVGRFDPVERESSRVAAFVSFSGPTDLVNYEAEGKSLIEFRLPEEIRKRMRIERFPIEFRDYHQKSLRYSEVTDKEEIQRRLKALSPVSLVSAESSPGLLIYGEKDKNVPVRQAEILSKPLRAAGVSVKLIIRKGMGHDNIWQAGDDKLVADWLDSLLVKTKKDTK